MSSPGISICLNANYCVATFTSFGSMMAYYSANSRCNKLTSFPLAPYKREQLSDLPTESQVKRSDFPWIGVFILVIATNIWLGAHNYLEARTVAETKSTAERLTKWLSEASEARQSGRLALSRCNDPTNAWRDCREELIAKDGPIPNARNLLNPSGDFFADACDRSNLSTLGSVVIEKGTPKPTDATQLIYTKMPSTQTLSEKLPLKVFVCGRSFHPMIVSEIVF